MEHFSLECRVTKPKQSLWPVTRQADNPMNQSEVELKQIHVAGAKRRKTHASKSRLVLVASDWLKKMVREFLAKHKA